MVVGGGWTWYEVEKYNGWMNVKQTDKKITNIIKNQIFFNVKIKRQINN